MDEESMNKLINVHRDTEAFIRERADQETDISFVNQVELISETSPK